MLPGPRSAAWQAAAWRAWRVVHPLRRRMVLALLAVCGLLASAGTSTVARAQAAPSGPNPLTVSGDGTATLPPDLANVSGAVQTKAQTAADALNQNSQTLSAVIAAVQAAGIASGDVKTTRLRVDPVTQSGLTVGYQATNGIVVKTTDLAGVGNLVQTMVSAGISNVSDVEYGLQDPNQLPVMALQAAVANAQREAQAIAAALGVTLGPAINFTAQPGLSAPSPISAPAPQPSGQGAAVPVLPGPFSESAHVTVTFALLAQ
jgi:uncharacterized protein YggE